MPGPCKYFLALWIVIYSGGAFAVVLPKRDQVLKKAGDLLDTWSISYVYGGSKLGDPQNCASCNRCLDVKKSTPKTRLIDCPVCTQCSLDCSHYTYEVFKQSGLDATYFTTSLMNALPASELASRYKLLDIGSSTKRAMPGDLLVYDGHVVLLEKKYPDGRGDIIHVTSGCDLKGPGNGIQRERLAPIGSFRGPVLRILRHLDMVKEMRDYYVQRQEGSANGRGKAILSHE